MKFFIKLRKYSLFFSIVKLVLYFLDFCCVWNFLEIHRCDVDVYIVNIYLVFDIPDFFCLKCIHNCCLPFLNQNLLPGVHFCSFSAISENIFFIKYECKYWSLVTVGPNIEMWEDKELKIKTNANISISACGSLFCYWFLVRSIFFFFKIWFYIFYFWIIMFYFFFNHTYCSNILYFKDFSSLSWKHTISLLLCDLEILYFKCVHWKTVPFFPMTQSCFYSQCKYDLTSRHVKRWGIVLQGEMLVQLHRLPLSCGNRQPSYEIVCLVNGTTRVELMSFWKWKFVS